MLNVSLRKITKHDLVFLANVYSSTRKEELAQTGWPIEQQNSFLYQQFDAQHKHYQAYYPEASFDVILLNDEPVGRLYVSRWEKQIRIVDIALLNEFRGQKIGTQLLQGLFSEARDKQQYVSIHVEKNNQAMAWYIKLGFCVVESASDGVYSLMKTNVLQKNFNSSENNVMIESTESVM